MAGFDFEFGDVRDGEALQRALLRWMQRKAREVGLRLSYRKIESGFYVDLNGPLPAMQALPRQLYPGLDAIADSFGAPPKLRDRRRILDRIRDAFEERLADMVEAINDVVGHLETKEGATVIGHSLDFDPGAKTHLVGTLAAFQAAVIQSYSGIPVRTLLEECHTVIEHLMDALLVPRSRNTLSFEQKVEVLRDREIFAAPGLPVDMIGGEIDAQLIELKDFRRDSKHRGQVPKAPDAERLADAAVMAVQMLLTAIRREGADRRSKSLPPPR